MAKIEPLGNWTARAAMADAMSEVEEGYEVLVLFRRSEKDGFSMRSANLTNATALFLLEEAKHDLVTKCFGDGETKVF